MIPRIHDCTLEHLCLWGQSVMVPDFEAATGHETKVLSGCLMLHLSLCVPCKLSWAESKPRGFCAGRPGQLNQDMPTVVWGLHDHLLAVLNANTVSKLGDDVVDC